MKKMKPDKAQMQQMSRFAVFQRESVDVEKRTVEVAFSSEEPVRRWFGDEVLSHAQGAVDLSRLNGGGAVLFNHDWDDQIGVIERAWIDADKRGRALGNGKIPRRARRHTTPYQRRLPSGAYGIGQS